MRNNPNSFVEARDRMLANLDKKMSKTVGHRGDMHIADFLKLDKDSGRMLVGYDAGLGPVGGSDVTAFVARQFVGQVVPMMETAKLHRDAAAVEVVVRRTVPTRKFEDRAAMHAVASTLFLDQELGDTWEVKSHTDGTKYLARVSKDDISAIVAERRRRMSVQASTATFSNALSAGIPNLNNGDTVRFYADSQLHEGKVRSVGNEVTIQADTGSYTVSPEAVVEILQVSPQTKGEIQSYLGEYFADAYGFEDYAGHLTNKLA
jgi:hypothetical protein